MAKEREQSIGESIPLGRLKVLHVTNAHPYEGSPEYGVFVSEQIASLRHAGVECSTYFINGRKRGVGAYLRAPFDVARLARGKDVIHCHHLYSALITLMVPRRRAKVVLSFLNDWTREVKLPVPEFIKLAMCRVGTWSASRIIFKSPVPREMAEDPRALNLPNGVDADFFAPMDRKVAQGLLGLDQGLCYLLFVSSKNLYRQQKRYDLFCDVVEELKMIRPDLKFGVITLVSEDRARMKLFLNAANVHVLTSDYEGSPNSVKEALVSGVPVVSRAVGNVEQMLAGVPHCKLVRASDAKSIAAEVALVAGQDVDREAIRRKFQQSGLSMQTIARRLADLYEELALGAKGG